MRASRSPGIRRGENPPVPKSQCVATRLLLCLAWELKGNALWGRDSRKPVGPHTCHQVPVKENPQENPGGVREPTKLSSQLQGTAWGCASGGIPAPG